MFRNSGNVSKMHWQMRRKSRRRILRTCNSLTIFWPSEQQKYKLSLDKESLYFSFARKGSRPLEARHQSLSRSRGHTAARTASPTSSLFSLASVEAAAAKVSQSLLTNIHNKNDNNFVSCNLYGTCLSHTIHLIYHNIENYQKCLILIFAPRMRLITWDFFVWFSNTVTYVPSFSLVKKSFYAFLFSSTRLEYLITVQH